MYIHMNSDTLNSYKSTQKVTTKSNSLIETQYRSPVQKTTAFTEREITHRSSTNNAHQSYHSWLSYNALADGDRRRDVCGLYSSVVEYLCCDCRTPTLDAEPPWLLLSGLLDLYTLYMTSQYTCQHEKKTS